MSNYLLAVEGAFQGDVDYAMLIKVYGTDQDSRKPERRYSPSVCLGSDVVPISGSPRRFHSG